MAAIAAGVSVSVIGVDEKEIDTSPASGCRCRIVLFKIETMQGINGGKGRKDTQMTPMRRNGVQQDFVEHGLFGLGEPDHRIGGGGRVDGLQARVMFFRADAHGVAGIDHGKAHGVHQAVEAIQSLLKMPVKCGQIRFGGGKVPGGQRGCCPAPHHTIESQVGRRI